MRGSMRQLWQRDHASGNAQAEPQAAPFSTKRPNQENDMPWTEVTFQSLEHAMATCEALAAHDTNERLRQFREHQSPRFQPARNLYAWYGERGPFEARPLIAAAYAHQFNVTPLTPGNFNGGNAQLFLEGLGFIFVPV